MSAALTPGAAPARARILSRAAFETRMLLANGEQLLVSLILPSLALVGLTLFFGYGMPPNPAWPALGFPGPVSAPPQV